MTIGVKSGLQFEPKMSVAMDATGQTGTPENFQPDLGPLANMKYKRTSWRYLVRLSSAPTTGDANIELLAGGTVIKSVAVSLSGATVISANTKVDLSAVAGETPIICRVDVTGAADAGIKATVDSVVDVESPLITGGC
ncbi:hypothetical protein [Marinobacter sp.]|uniref:hypothetical protein n=1 Tax=Marinobacter sp. TaxID=50741 RepID=UPI00261EF0D3|nr:hypothetical protein [Marinobacter sp.]